MSRRLSRFCWFHLSARCDGDKSITKVANAIFKTQIKITRCCFRIKFMDSIQMVMMNTNETIQLKIMNYKESMMSILTTKNALFWWRSQVREFLNNSWTQMKFHSIELTSTSQLMKLNLSMASLPMLISKHRDKLIFLKVHNSLTAPKWTINFAKMTTIYVMLSITKTVRCDLRSKINLMLEFKFINRGINDANLRY